MAARPISVNRFAEAVQERLIDADEVKDIIGVRNRQTVFDRVEAGTLPAPILKRHRAFTFWDRYAVLNALTSTRR